MCNWHAVVPGVPLQLNVWAAAAKSSNQIGQYHSKSSFCFPFAWRWEQQRERIMGREIGGGQQSAVLRRHPPPASGNWGRRMWGGSGGSSNGNFDVSNFVSTGNRIPNVRHGRVPLPKRQERLVLGSVTFRNTSQRQLRFDLPDLKTKRIVFVPSHPLLMRSRNCRSGLLWLPGTLVRHTNIQ